jgi:hypothetical protein
MKTKISTVTFLLSLTLCAVAQKSPTTPTVRTPVPAPVQPPVNNSINTVQPPANNSINQIQNGTGYGANN